MIETKHPEERLFLMKIIGIIAEYNPFHNGHAYQIRKIKETLHADFVVIAMSGDFVQRGAPAIINKYARTAMALSCGADLVIELPVLWATASAESFAMAGISLFKKMGCVDGICFGAETDNLPLLSLIAEVFAEEPPAFRALLSSYLKEGSTFPSARCKALYKYLGTSVFTENEADLTAVSSILAQPNNILAIEYLKALKLQNAPLIPYLIRREGAGYHERTILKTVSCSDTNELPSASATAIRKLLKDGDFARLNAVMPAAASEILKARYSRQEFLCPDDFSAILGCRLLTCNTGNLSAVLDCTPDIANRIFKNRMQFFSFSQFCDLCKSKDITYSRISRILLHLILDITTEDYLSAKNAGFIPYLRILGFRRDASALLKCLKNAASVPLVSKLADAASYLNMPALHLLKKDIFAADLYEQTCAIKKGAPSGSEYTKNIIRL